MIAAALLGARLAVGTPGQRGRSLLVALAAGSGALVLLTVTAVVAAEQSVGSVEYTASELGRLSAAVTGAVALPVLVLAATVGRLSASIRDRRLANLRLLGLDPFQTRVVAVTESGLVACVGVVTGALAFALLRPALAGADIAGRSWSLDQLHPGPAAWVLSLVGIPAVSMAVAAIPHRSDPRRTMERARRTDSRRPSLLRLLPLGAGLVLCRISWGANDDNQVQSGDVALIFTGLALTAVGVVIVVPVFVRLLADLTHKLGRGPVALIAARRLQAQPAAVTRVIAALMVGLFLVVGARSVVVAFETTPQYASAAEDIESQQRVGISVRADRSRTMATRAAEIEGVRDVIDLPVLRTDRRSSMRGAFEPVVATCSDLLRVEPRLEGCVDGRPMLITYSDILLEDDLTITLRPKGGAGRGSAGPTQRVTVPYPTEHITLPGPDELELDPLRPTYSTIVVPPSYPGIHDLSSQTQHTVIAVGGSGRDLAANLAAAGLSPSTATDYASYDFVASLRLIVWTLAGVILGLGLLTFTIAAIDRALTRRSEITSLQVLGASPATLRRAQWIESALPTTLGTGLAILTGLFAGITYLHLYGDLTDYFPWTPILTLSSIAVAASLLLAGLTVLATNTRITPENIRIE